MRKLSPDPILQAVADHWDSLDGLLVGQDAERFRLLVGRICAAGGPVADRDDATDELVDLLLRVLPDDHPVWRVIVEGSGTRGLAPAELAPAELAYQEVPDDEPVLAELRRLLDGNENSAQVAMRAAVSRLLAAPALSAAELRALGGDPDQAHLIILDGPEGRRLPAFQFDPAGRPVSVVLDINALLDADGDPWGVADWWLGRNAWLGRAPAESLHHVVHKMLLDAARATAQGD